MKIVTVLLSLVCCSMHAMEDVTETTPYKLNVSSWETDNQKVVLQGENNSSVTVLTDSLQTALKHYTDLTGGEDCIAQVYIQGLNKKLYILTFCGQEVWEQFYATHSGDYYREHQYKLEQRFKKNLEFMRSLKQEKYAYIKERLSRAPSMKSEQAKIATGVITSLCLLYYINRKQQNFYHFLDALEELIEVHNEILIRMLVFR
jgi:hypothetical protein